MGAVHIIILAAGLGSRLTSAGYEGPKWLLDVSGSTIAERQLQAIIRATAGRYAEVTVVAGHRADFIAQYVSEVHAVDVRVVINNDYATRNNWYSLLLGLDHLQMADGDRVVVINSDLCAGTDWLTEVISAIVAADGEVLAIDSVRELTPEAMKVSVRVESGASLLRSIGKENIEGTAHGEYIGMLGMSRGGVEELQQQLRAFERDIGRYDEWYEAAIGATASSLNWHLYPVPDSQWTEIDDPSDLHIAGAQA